MTDLGEIRYGIFWRKAVENIDEFSVVCATKVIFLLRVNLVKTAQ
jgi:hypothetical protein